MLKVYKFILLFMCILFQNPAFAVDACVEDENNGIIPVILDPSIGSQGDATYDGDYSYDNYQATWRAPYTHVTYHGVSACLSSQYDTRFFGIKKNLVENGQPVKGGEQTGRFCWCKLVYPVVSEWLSNNGVSNDYTSLSECVNSGCAQRCVGRFKNRPVMRAALFSSVQQ